ncbi:MAG: VanZ family protein [Pirellulales bacterium]|nr:VanZ family protein [Pirellulales bacterium]
MLRIVRLTCIAYTLALSVLLLLPNVGFLLGWWVLRGGPGGIGRHFAAFTVLGLLVAASRIPMRRARLAATMVTYAIGIELLQFLSPPRSVEWLDAVENLLGLAAGLALWQLWRRVRSGKKPEEGVIPERLPVKLGGGFFS